MSHESTKPGVKIAPLEIGGRKAFVVELPSEPCLAPLDRLSAAERAVVELVLDGCTNREIAQRRGASVRTVGSQLEGVYRKLEVGSRTELVALLCERPV